jgi:hypothetical protein
MAVAKLIELMGPSTTVFADMLQGALVKVSATATQVVAAGSVYRMEQG